MMMNQPNEFMNDMIRETQKTFETGMNATSKFMQAACQVFATPGYFPTQFEDVRECNERFTKNLAPAMKDNFEACSGAWNTQMRAGMDLFKKSFEKPMVEKDVNWVQTTESNMKDAMNVFRGGLDLAADTGVKVMNRWNAMVKECMIFSKPEASTKTESAKSNK